VIRPLIDCLAYEKQLTIAESLQRERDARQAELEAKRAAKKAEPRIT
jgi:hypothetical protein